MDKGFFKFAVVVIVILTGAFCFACFLAEQSCRAEWEASGFNSEFTILGGCRIEVEPGKRVPARNYREFNTP